MLPETHVLLGVKQVELKLSVRSVFLKKDLDEESNTVRSIQLYVDQISKYIYLSHTIEPVCNLKFDIDCAL